VIGEISCRPTPEGDGESSGAPPVRAGEHNRAGLQPTLLIPSVTGTGVFRFILSMSGDLLTLTDSQMIVVNVGTKVDIS
jgi:hypothetical protein